MAKRPLLKQFATLGPQDFQQHPVWISVHTVDYGEAWYDETDEETFRPWMGELPVSPAEGMLLVKASFTLADGQSLPGFLTPIASDENQNLGTIQPHMFLPGGQQLPFWFGILRPDWNKLRVLLASIPVVGDKVFPIGFQAEPGLLNGMSGGALQGFYYQNAQGSVVLER